MSDSCRFNVLRVVVAATVAELDWNFIFKYEQIAIESVETTWAENNDIGGHFDGVG